ncbi:MAG: hypothetical protein ACREH6_00130 [Geminicoccaceae bacterium]
MSLSLIRSLPSIPLPRLDPGAVLRRHREVVLAHLGPLFALLALLCVTLWALSEYTTHRIELSRAEIERYVEEFESPPVAGAWRHLSGVWRVQTARQEALLEELAPLSGEALQRRLPDYQRFVLHTVEEHRLGPDIETVLGFIKRLGLCVRSGGCDRSVAAASFGDELRRFRNQHYYYFRFEQPDQEIDRSLAVILSPERLTHTIPAGS